MVSELSDDADARLEVMQPSRNVLLESVVSKSTLQVTFGTVGTGRKTGVALQVAMLAKEPFPFVSKACIHAFILRFRHRVHV